MSQTGLSVLERVQNPQDFILGMGKMFSESGLLGCKTHAQGIVLAMHCMTQGVSPLEIMQTYHFIEGKLSMRADAMLGRANAAGYRHRVVSRTPDLAEIEITPPVNGIVSANGSHGSVSFSLSWADAQKEPFVRDRSGGIKTNWNTPRIRMQMLWARVVSDAVRTMAPGVVCGAYTPEELGDEPEAIEAEVTAAPAPQQSAEPAKRARKPKEEAPAAAPAPVASQPVEQLVPAQAESTPPAAAAPQVTGQSIADTVAKHVPETAPAQAPAQKAPESTALPQIVSDIIALKGYVGPKWPKGPEDWDATWIKVMSALKVPDGSSDGERLTKADDATRGKIHGWLSQQRDIVDKLATSKDLNSWANQTPQTSAMAGS